ncbi:hypothetical protein C8J57DRAFT_1226715 [Mycena rebaudengoi]|nr:hypothetical protein C8J57DRAFT_1226715 [Mycena rebaudengoi]
MWRQWSGMVWQNVTVSVAVCGSDSVWHRRPLSVLEKPVSRCMQPYPTCSSDGATLLEVAHEAERQEQRLAQQEIRQVQRTSLAPNVEVEALYHEVRSKPRSDDAAQCRTQKTFANNNQIDHARFRQKGLAAESGNRGGWEITYNMEAGPRNIGVKW